MLQYNPSYFYPSLPNQGSYQLCAPTNQQQQPGGKEKAKKFRKSKFSPAEDQVLKELVNVDGPNDWSEIASHFVNRNVRQVKERWEYYLSPDVNNGPWTPEEDAILIQKYNELGTKWTVIAKSLKGRTNTCCKNRWIAMQRNASRESDGSPSVGSPTAAPNAAQPQALPSTQPEKAENLASEPRPPISVREFIPQTNGLQPISQPFEDLLDPNVVFQDEYGSFQESSYFDLTPSLW